MWVQCYSQYMFVGNIHTVFICQYDGTFVYFSVFGLAKKTLDTPAVKESCTMIFH